MAESVRFVELPADSQGWWRSINIASIQQIFWSNGGATIMFREPGPALALNAAQASALRDALS